MKIDKPKVKRILVITLSNLGDIVLTTPVVQCLIQEFPDAKMDIMVSPVGKGLFRDHLRINSLIAYNKRSTFLQKIALFVRLRKVGYDLVCDLRNTVLPLLIGARYITSPIRNSGDSAAHKKDTHLSRLSSMGIDISKADFYIPVSETSRINAEKLLGITGKNRYVVLSPGAKSHVKRWPLKNFAGLADMIKKELGIETVLVGDSYDRVVVERILFNMKTKPVDLVEKTKIPELAHIIGKAALLITNDSAPLHIGSAMGTRIVAFFGPTSDAEYGPATKNKSRVLNKKITCSPCKVPQCVNTDRKYECLRTISVEEAFEAVKELVQGA